VSTAGQLIEDISENISKRMKRTANLVSDAAAEIQLRPFEIKTFKLTKS
jgi:hypothetical protein